MDSDAHKTQKIRSFVALHPDAETASALRELQQKLQRDITTGVRWAKPEQLHLTLQFLGYIEAHRVDEFTSAIRTVAGRYGPFRLRAEGIGCFPSKRRPRIIWAGLLGDTKRLQSIKTDVDKSLSKLGYVPEERPFHPHITLGRVSELGANEIAKLQKWTTECETITFGEWQVKGIYLMKSILSPKGANYHLIESSLLGSAGK